MKEWKTGWMRRIKAAPWPHGTALCSLLVALGLGVNASSSLAEGLRLEAAMVACWAFGWLVVALIAGADGISRHREYRRIKAMFARYGFNRRILAPVSASRCQRDAALLAAAETGHLAHARDYFRSRGYRWYHILPDSVCRNPLVFLSPSFIRSAFLPGKRRA
ncbi:hypothetical protein [Pseudodesulfovibrio tunisiensis]|uniref:hypothetical protein n=1 Tax=Pseudodesulfovibrio tunisiensis TaxID=463192 RepID=UPI001FB4B9CB|nr:hypothetical protein [Pseudodesulfovibrio tunisiensis]